MTNSLAIGLASMLLLGCLASSASMLDAQSSSAPAVHEPIAPLPAAIPSNSGKVGLGEKLFNDARLSGGNRTACTSCHQLERGGDDGRARTRGADGRLLPFNVPTVFNASLSFRLNWRGNYRSLEEQAEAVLLDPRLMNTTWQELIAKLRGHASYTAAFTRIYRREPQRADVLDALAAYERSLVTPNARFDRYLRGERNAITPDEQRGYELFESHGCTACHQGVNVGGNLFQRFGIFHDPFEEHPVGAADLGRFTITHRSSDRHVFRVPSLRNVAVTAPYFHDGRARRLTEAVQEMARSQLGRRLTNEQVALIVKFLHTLTGEYKGKLLSDGKPPASVSRRRDAREREAQRPPASVSLRRGAR